MANRAAGIKRVDSSTCMHEFAHFKTTNLQMIFNCILQTRNKIHSSKTIFHVFGTRVA